ncbi:hypothetical protein COX24_01200 [bacterium (Candidatus Gribaldobacteria) CG23_combo_of_CG06-09_8_20_14_all_37_87_8]|uniref:Uncharacterized protein n=2 Tax=Candidatus Gribaldobacteria TaxID=2798536 RepID=A0A2G9ZFE2_9BACT|nr:MAG: hypothetical protein COX24_01200 [bacterium (Candidatus Gribaldobacteria) CG23_combo_of_CG06-09_8_20_14_all_37_87_8]PIR90701.1 MAG: hypothetical protein COU05_00605 [bacterium (Candidatus Gribaldobacteria) CG10_big_fil_rev_8_21_14_0_10_37_21]
MEEEILVKLNKIEQQNEKIKKRLWWVNFFSALRVVFVLVPLILAVIYLPALINNLLKKYQELVPQSSLNNNINLPDFNNWQDLFNK